MAEVTNLIGERLSEYRLRAGFTVAEFAEMLGLKGRTYYSYLPTDGRANDPPWSAVVEWSRRMMVSLDWLAGQDVTMWSRPLFEPYAEALQKQVATNPPVSRVFRERVCAVIKSIHELDKEQFGPLTLAAILRLTPADAAGIIGGETRRVPEETTMIIQALFEISDDWFHTTR